MASTSKRPHDGGGDRPKECAVCCDAFTGYARKPVVCAQCDFQACVRCYQKYLVTVANPACMSCAHAFNREFIDATFTHAWVVGEYSRHRQQVLLESELIHLPTSQHLVHNFRIHQDIITRLRLEQQEKTQLYQRIHQIGIGRWNLSARAQRIKASNFQNDGLTTGAGAVPAERGATFVRACPVDSCRGFLSTALKCGTCEVWACGDCFGVIGEARDSDHTCDPGDIETATLIKRTSRPCPKCAISISKIDGCFAADVRIMTWDGPCKTAQAIVAGDVLVGDDGRPRTVLETFSGEDELFTVTQATGDAYTVNSKHTLVLKSHDMETFELTVDEFLELPPEAQASLFGFKTNEMGITAIAVTPCGRGRYYGWRVDGNKRFILPDTTVVRNCDQMWCVQCHTAFSWRHGTVITGHIHNPELFRWLREHGEEVPRAPGDNPGNACGVLPTHMRMHDVLRTKGGATIDQKSLVMSIYRHARHVDAVDLPGLATPAVETDNTDLRRRYLMGELGRDAWKRMLVIREKRREKELALRYVYEMFVAVTRDIFIAFCDSDTDTSVVLERLHEQCVYTNKCLEKIKARFKCALVISEIFRTAANPM